MMTAIKLRHLWILALCLVATAVAAPQGTSPAILKPPWGELVTNRLSFPVRVSVPDLKAIQARGYHVWVTLAQAEDGELGTDHWPKFYIKQSAQTSDVYDGGTNPLATKDDWMLLIIQVDSVENSKFENWHKQGRLTGQYPPLTLGAETKILARQLIYFP